MLPLSASGAVVYDPETDLSVSVSGHLAGIWLRVSNSSELHEQRNIVSQFLGIESTLRFSDAKYCRNLRLLALQ